MSEPLAMFPLSTVLYPHAQIPLHIFEPRYRTMAQDCLAGDGSFGVVLISRGSEVGGGDQRMMVGTRAIITRAATLSDGRWLLVAEGDARIRITEWLVDDPYPRAVVEEWDPEVDDVPDSMVEQAIQNVRRVRGLLAESGSAAALSADVAFSTEADVAVWQLCGEMPFNMMDAQRLLTASGTLERLELLAELVADTEDDLRRLMAAE